MAAVRSGHGEQDLPGYVTINPPPTFGRAVNYGSAFLPVHFQGTRISDTGHLPNVQAASAGSLQRRQIDLIQAMNRDLAAKRNAPDPVDGIIESYELAFRMQSKVPELLDISKRAAIGAGCIWCEARTRGIVCPPVLDGAAIE